MEFQWNALVDRLGQITKKQFADRSAIPTAVTNPDWSSISGAGWFIFPCTHSYVQRAAHRRDDTQTLFNFAPS